MRKATQVGIFFLLAILCASLLSGYWIRQEIYDEDQYVDSAVSVIRSKGVQDGISHIVLNAVDGVIQTYDWPQLVDELTQDPEVKANLLAARESFGLFVEEEIVAILNAPEFEAIWIEIHRTAHEQIILPLATGEASDVLATSGAAVRVNLYPVYELLVIALAAKGFDLSMLGITQDMLWLKVYESEKIVEFQDGLHQLNRLLEIIALVIVLLVVALVLMSRNRLRGVAYVGAAVVAGTVLAQLVAILGRAELGSLGTDEAERAAAYALFDAFTVQLQRWTWIAIATGLIVAAVFIAASRVSTRSMAENRS